MKHFSYLCVIFLILLNINSYSQITTSAINGKITGPDKTSLPGATIIALHEPTQSQFGTTTDADGFFTLRNLNIGGPYTITISYLGYEPQKKENIYLSLGQGFRINAQLQELHTQLEGVEIVAVQRDLFDGNRTGAETIVREEAIAVMPTVTRDIFDFARLTPQANFNGTSISIAGTNNRYNSISIDGAVNNDVFGLAANGQNGGQTGGSPFSIDAIEQFQIVLAPYDVRYSGFAGGNINAVTRSGSNQVEGSAYYLFRNENISGMTPTNNSDIDRKKLAEFSSRTYGFRVGGPIIKNKLFFFVNGEIQKEETPQPFDFSNYAGDASREKIDQVINKLNEYGYNPGGFENNTRTLDGTRLFARLDYNLNKNNKLSLRNSFTKNEATSPNSSNSKNIFFNNNGQYFPSTTNTTTAEWKLNLNRTANNLIFGYTMVRDDRDPMGANFPSVIIYDGASDIYFGSEPYSTANQLDQNIITLTDNLTLYLGKHTLTLGTHNEYTSVYNLFMRKNFGEYRFNSIENFIEGNAFQYEASYSLVDDKIGDGSKAAADFNMLQMGFYLQDDVQLNESFKITGGLRFDIPVFTEHPTEDKYFNQTTVNTLEDAGWDLQGARAGKMPETQLLFSPRIGFNWDVNNNQTTQLRGGTGIFTSRLPLVWPAGCYTNNGLTIGGVYIKHKDDDIAFNPNWQTQPHGDFFYIPEAKGQMDLFTKDFKFPQVLRTSLAVDQKLPWNITGTLEFMYSKTLNNVLYYNINRKKEPVTTLEGVDNRPIYSSAKLDNTYTRIMLGTNTNKGYSYNVTAQLQKPFNNGLTASLAYTFGQAKSLNDGTSSQNSSQWRYMENVNGLNNLELTYSDFDMGHRFVGFFSYRVEFLNHLASTFSLVYNGQSGQRYSYVYDDDGDLNGEGENPGNLIFVPQTMNDINLTDIINDDGVVIKTAQEQWNDLNAFITKDDYLNDRRGKYAQRNGSRMPWENIIDLKFSQDLWVNVSDKKQTLQFTLDIFNFTNILNKEWGRRQFISNAAYKLISFTGMEEGTNKPTFQYNGGNNPDDIFEIDDSGVTSSRWQAQIGIRYIF